LIDGTPWQRSTGTRNSLELFTKCSYIGVLTGGSLRGTFALIAVASDLRNSPRSGRLVASAAAMLSKDHPARVQLTRL
jgi:hypothetical protein